MKISFFFRSFCKFFSSAGALFNKARYPNWHCGLNVELNISRSQITADGKVYIGAYSRFYFNKESNLYIGNNVNFGRDVHLQADGSTIEIGHGTSIQDHCRIYGNVYIGNYTIFAPNVFVSSGTHIYDALPSRLIIDQERLSSVKDKPVFIGDDCWIGINSVVMQGVTIGKGCIVAANSVVTKDVLPYSVVAGAPATLRKIRYNFKPPQYISANEINDQPYFYSGFDYLNLHPEFGYPTSKNSCVALFLDGATTLTIKLYSQNLPAHMRFEGKDYWISPGWNEIKIPACSQVFYNLEISGPCFIMSANLLE